MSNSNIAKEARRIEIYQNANNRLATPIEVRDHLIRTGFKARVDADGSVSYKHDFDRFPLKRKGDTRWKSGGHVSDYRVLDGKVYFAS